MNFEPATMNFEQRGVIDTVTSPRRNRFASRLCTLAISQRPPEELKPVARAGSPENCQQKDLTSSGRLYSSPNRVSMRMQALAVSDRQPAKKLGGKRIKESPDQVDTIASVFT